MPTQSIPDELDFLGARARVLAAEGSAGIVDIAMPAGSMSPLHVHHDEDEGFFVLEGEITLFLPGDQVTLRAGEFFLAPRQVPHAYLVGDSGAHCLVSAAADGFPRFVAAVAALDAPTPEALGAVAADHDIEILGPPGARP